MRVVLLVVVVVMVLVVPASKDAPEASVVAHNVGILISGVRHAGSVASTVRGRHRRRHRRRRGISRDRMGECGNGYHHNGQEPGPAYPRHDGFAS